MSNFETYHRRRNRGFTLLEILVYVAIFSIFLTVVLGFFWQMQQARIKAGVSREVKENASHIIESLKYSIRNAYSLDAGQSRFGIPEGVLVLNIPAGAVIFDLPPKTVTLGGKEMVIHKLRITNGSELPYDLNSDHVNVTQFQITNLTSDGHPPVVLIQLGLASANPGTDPLYSQSFTAQFSVGLRNENP